MFLFQHDPEVEVVLVNMRANCRIVARIPIGTAISNHEVKIASIQLVGYYYHRGELQRCRHCFITVYAASSFGPQLS